MPSEDHLTGLSAFHRLHALRNFAEFQGSTQSQQHIRPLHDYISARLVLEGGFRPAELNPRPPLRIDANDSRHRLVYDPTEARSSETTILGGLKTKNVDIVATKEGIGPVLAISCRGMIGAVRNLTNRLGAPFLRDRHPWTSTRRQGLEIGPRMPLSKKKGTPTPCVSPGRRGAAVRRF